MTILVGNDHLTAMPQVVERLRAVGLVIESQADQIGVITGRIRGSRVPILEQVQEVEHVEISRRFQLPPPDSDLQ